VKFDCEICLRTARYFNTKLKVLTGSKYFFEGVVLKYSGSEYIPLNLCFESFESIFYFTIENQNGLKNDNHIPDSALYRVGN
jgi:hypothetical protein